ncbi:hypothetical protein UFOVP824_16 [uncultured Caudovirales phage]|uniref:Uncharacterized protein n=1 Tax=uncultured Caudovirales phage TaxID=2100421 RepID=A0A6J5P4R0_9CAUD|nr:hypothetical protein UFOVP824_16 [uncultured Caudovirales phage]
MIRQHGGIFGRNPTYQNVEVNGIITVHGDPYLPQTAETTNTFGDSASENPFQATTGTGGATAPVVLYKAVGDNGEPYTNITNKTPLSISVWQEFLFGSEIAWVGNVMFSVVNGFDGTATFTVLDNGTINTPLANASTVISESMSSHYLTVNEVGSPGTEGPFYIMYGSSLDAGVVWELRDIATDNDFDGIADAVMRIGDGGDIQTCGGLACQYLNFGYSQPTLAQQTASPSSWQQARVTRTSTTIFTAVAFNGGANSYGALKVVIQARNSTAARYELVEMNVIWNDGVTTVSSAVVNTLIMGASLGTYTFDQSSGLVRLRITPALSSSTTFTITTLALSRP